MKKYIRTKTLRVQLMRYHFLIICLIATFVSICTYITANQKTLEVAKKFPETPCRKYFLPKPAGI